MIVLASTNNKNYNDVILKSFSNIYSIWTDNYLTYFGEINNKEEYNIKNIFFIENKKFNYSLGINILLKILNKKNIDPSTPIMITDCSTYIGQRSLKKLIPTINFKENFITVNTLKRDIITIPQIEKTDILYIQSRCSYFNRKVIEERENSIPVFITNFENLMCLNGLEENISTELSRIQIIQKLKNIGIKEIIADFNGLCYLKNSIPKNFKISDDNNINNKEVNDNWGILQNEITDNKIEENLPVIEKVININEINNNYAEDQNYSIIKETEIIKDDDIHLNNEKDKDFINYYNKMGIIISSSSNFNNRKNWEKFHIFINSLSNYHRNIDIIEYDMDNKKSVDFNAIKNNKNLKFKVINKDNEETLKDYEFIITHQNTKLLEFLINYNLNSMLFITENKDNTFTSSNKINKIKINKNTTSKSVTDFLMDIIYEKYRNN